MINGFVKVAKSSTYKSKSGNLKEFGRIHPFF